MFLFSLAETMRKLDHKRKLWVHRRFLEILDEAYNEQLYENSQRDEV